MSRGTGAQQMTYGGGGGYYSPYSNPAGQTYQPENRGNHNFSVYDTPDTDFGDGGLFGRSGTANDQSRTDQAAITKENLPNYNNPAESATDAYQSQFGTVPPNEPLTFGSMMGNIKDYALSAFRSAPIVRIAGSVYDGSLFNDTGQWLGDFADSPWNPMNWESGDPAQGWTVELPDGTVMMQGDTAQSGMLGYGGGVPGSGTLSGGAEVGDTLTTAGGGTVILSDREYKRPGDPGYIQYGNAPILPEDMDIPDGHIYNYRTNELQDLRGNPYYYRVIDSNNAYKENVLPLLRTDEEWLAMSEAERQENFEARSAALDPYNFGSESTTSPFGQTSVYNNLLPVGSEDRTEVLRQAYLNGEITSTELSRYLDDATRAQGAKTEEQIAVDEGMDFLVDQGGYTEEEAETLFGNNFTRDEFSSEGVRSQEDFFNYFDDSLTELTDVDVDLESTMYRAYDDKREQDYANAFNYLDSLQGSDDFIDAYQGTDITKRNAYIVDLYERDLIDEQQYTEAVVANLVEAGEFVFQLEDGTYATGTENGIYDDYKVIVPPGSADENEQQYYDYLKNRTFDDIEEVEGFTAEENERRAEIARLDNLGGVAFDDRKAERRPRNNWYDDILQPLKIVALDFLTAGAYTAIPALVNIAKGEGNTEDYVRVAPGLLEATGVTTPPVSAEEAAVIQDNATNNALDRGYSPSDAAQYGYDAGQRALEGTGLNFGVGELTYEQTNSAIKYAGNGNIKEFVIQELAAPYIKDMFEGVDTDLFEGKSPEFVTRWQDTWDNMPEDVKAGLNSAMDSVLAGDNREEILTGAVKDYLEASGFDNFVEDSLRQRASDFDDNYLQPLLDFEGSFLNVDAAKQFLGILSSSAQEVGRTVGDYVDPALGAVGDAGSTVDDAVSDAIGDTSSAVGDVIDPALGAVGDAGSDIDDIRRETGSDIEDTIKENVPQGTTPENPFAGSGGDGESFGSPDFDLDFNFGFGGAGGTRQDPYEYDPFVMKTEVGLSDRPFLEYRDPSSSKPTDKDYYYIEDFLTNDPFKSTL